MDDTFWDEVRWHLFQQLLIQQEHEYGKEFMSDRFLTDFSAAWGTISRVDGEHGNGGVRDHIPQYVIDEAIAYEQQQKATVTVTVFGDGPSHIRNTPTSDRFQT